MRALGWLVAVLGALMVFAWGASYAVLVGMVKMSEFPVALHALGGVGLVLIGLWVFLDWGSLSQFGKDQTVQRSATAGVLLLVGFAVTAALNVVGHRYDKRWDLTLNKRFSVSDQTTTVVGALDKEVEIIAFFQTGSPEESNFRELLKGYTEASTLIKVNFYDPIGDNLMAKQEKITTEYGTVIVRAGGSEQRITGKFDEEALTNAVVKATSSTSHTLCVVGGHGEVGTDQPGNPDGLDEVLGTLEKQNYTIRPVELLAAQPTPADCEVLLLSGPKTDPLPGELDRMAQYVAAGGRLIVSLDPLETPGLAADMARYGVKVGNDVVIEQDPYRQLAGGGPTFVVLDGKSFSASPITEKLTTGAVVMPLARSVSKGPELPGLTVTELAHTSEMSWAETRLDDISSVQPQPDEGADILGNVSVAVAVEVTDPAAIPLSSAAAALPTVEGAPMAPVVAAAEPLPGKAGGRVVVFGDSDFAKNQFGAFGLNSDLLLNAVGWSADDAAQLTIRASEAKVGKLDAGLIPSTIAVLVALFGVPGLAMVGAVGTYMRRRSQ
jgi:ABC-type uncharacterized transport system involved in gliding motility auxiliary subunit